MTREDVMSFIKVLISSKQMSQSEIAKEIGCSRQSINQAIKVNESRMDGSREKVLNHFGYQVVRKETFIIGAK